MKISKKSWHYRLIRRTWINCDNIVDWHTKEVLPISLCGYLFVLMATFFWYAVVPILFVLAVTVFIVAGPFILIEFLCECYRNRPKLLGLVRAWLAAKKAKVCPMIEWED